MEGKKKHFSFICRVFAMATVFKAMKTVAIATRTVVVTHEDGRHGNDDRPHGDKLRTSRVIDGKILGHNRVISGFTRKYSILRELRIITLSQFPGLN
ncbi:hypothetical protein [uncultured Parabacteroides sp.]|uniref:hypothetical protein n=1 Tax=uncultured Parabacteroides sp. TaxID=512312 RepID=UPI0028048E5F|nr:hypothetical protein [uncultured Parabacteroides sp.]